jgi:hypothetical protein
MGQTDSNSWDLLLTTKIASFAASRVRFLVKKTADLGIEMADLGHFLANFGVSP